MSDHPPPTGSYGEQSPQPDGQPYGQPYPTSPEQYGASTSGAAAYGSAPVSDKRPGTVTAAAVITIIFSVLGALASAGIAIAFQAARDDVVDELQGDPSLKDVDPDTIVNVGVVVGIVLVVWCLAAIVLSVLVLRRSKVARVLLVVSSVVTALISLVTILSLVSAVTLIAAIAVIVLLFTGGAGDWFARRPGDPQQAPPYGTTAS